LFNFLVSYTSLLLEKLFPTLILIIVSSPILSTLLIISFHQKSHLRWILTSIGLLQILLSICTLLATYSGTTFHISLPCLQLNEKYTLSLGVYVDFLTALMLLMISLVSWLIALYSINYLESEPSKKRYFTLLNLFISTISWVVVADNLWGIFIGWELVGILSCLLISFWYQEISAVKASMHAWFTSKLGSICFLIGILLVISELGDCSLLTITQATPSTKIDIAIGIHVAGICFLTTAFTKSAQFPFFNWLPEAMIAPTPISALLHAATILSLGIYLTVRIQPILPHELQNILIIIGYITAFMGACAALAQQHIKRMLAYSTISQLGYVTAAIGMQAWETGILYLLIHAFAKACLFLCTGIVVRFIEQSGTNKQNVYDMSHMGGIAPYLPWVASSYLLGGLALIGLPGLTGFIAKETMLEKTLMWSIEYAQSGYYIAYLIPLLGFTSTLLTILYLGNSFLKIFCGIPTWKTNTDASRKSLSNHWYGLMQGSILAFAGCNLIFSMPIANQFLLTGLKRIDQSHVVIYLPIITPIGIHYSVICLSIACLLFAIPLLLLIFKKSERIKLFLNSSKLVRLFMNGWYLDALTKLTTKQVLIGSKLFVRIENQLINGFINYVGVSYVVMAHMIAWLDNKLLAGVGYGIAIVFKSFSKLYLHLQKSSLQKHLLWTYVVMVLLFIVWVMWNGFF